jgi:hypothetical protein
VYDDRDDFCDVMFMSMFPGIAPIYRPNSLLAWTLWFNSMNYMPGQYFYDPYALNDWAFVPGFPGAVSQMIVPFGDGYRVEILDGAGLCMGNFGVSGYGEQMQIITGDGDMFSVMNAGQPYIQYADGDQAFCWNGVDDPFTGSPLDVQAAIMDAGPMYEPGPMLGYTDAFVADPGYAYADPGYAVDPGGNPFYPDNGGGVDYNPNDGYIQPDSSMLPGQYDAPPDTWQDSAPVSPDVSYDAPQVDTYSNNDSGYSSNDNYSSNDSYSGSDSYSSSDSSSSSDSYSSSDSGGGDSW